MSTSARKRLLRDFRKYGPHTPAAPPPTSSSQRLQSDTTIGITAAPTDNDIMLWDAIIFGPQDTPFEDGTFKLKLEFTEEYPTRPPVVQFTSRIFHPNVYPDGRICLDILQSRWSPTYDVEAILTSIQSLLNEPNTNSPANNEAAELFSKNKNEYVRRIRECVKLSLNLE